MGLNAKEYAKRYGITTKRVKKLYDMGYLPNATKDEKTGVYDIPESTPVPHRTTCTISKLDTLKADLLEAALRTHSISEKMYPRFPSGTIESIINELVDMELIRIISTTDGMWRLTVVLEELKTVQEYIKANPNSETKKKCKKVFEDAYKYVSFTAAVCTIFSTFFPPLAA